MNFTNSAKNKLIKEQCRSPNIIVDKLFLRSFEDFPSVMSKDTAKEKSIHVCIFMFFR
jgi:hypothetical protein